MNSLVENCKLCFSDAGYSTFFHQLFINGQYTDVYFDLDHEGKHYNISAHKFVLSLRSSYFADKFYGEDKAVNFIPLNNIDPVYMKAMLSYMYDYTPPLQTTKQICGTYRVAKEFLVISLMNLCQERFNKIEISPSNMFDMLKAADYLQNQATRDRCLNVFQEKTKEVFAANCEFTETSPSMIKFLLTSKKLSLDSLFDFFMWIFEWSNKRYKNDSSISSPRQAVEEFLPNLPFASLKVEEFADLYRCHADFFNKNEVIQIFMNYALPDSSIPMPNWYNEKCQMDLVKQI